MMKTTYFVVAAGAIYAVNRFLRAAFEKKIIELHKDLGDDYLNINRLMSFGVNDSCHNDKICEDPEGCTNIQCRFGRLKYILDFVRNAKQTVDVCIYLLTSDLFAKVLLEAHNNRVRVRIIPDADSSFSSGSKVNYLLEKGIPVRRKMSKYIMHHKFIIVDNEILMNGSMNFTSTGTFCNIENVMVTTQPALVIQFVQTFQKMWVEFGTS